MKKRTLALILVILIALAALWLTRQQTLPTTDQQQTGVATSSLAEITEAQPDSAATDEPASVPQTGSSATAETSTAPDEYGTFTAKDDVCAYLVAYGRLPENFITKDEARSFGWSGGGLDDFAYGKCIGGDRFGNYEGLLPEANGRYYTECDIGTLHKDSRGAERIVFSNDGLIYYTDDHYESFTLLYGTP